MFEHMRKKCDAVCAYLREQQTTAPSADVAHLRSGET
jgi:hypothetical protein